MAYEWTDFDEAVQLIDPWHGLYRASDGKIEAANGIRTAVKGLAPICSVSVLTPSAAPVQIPACDSVLVRRPGQSPVTTPASELALGKTWLNYNIQAGGTKVMAGRYVLNWMYQAPDGSRWAVSNDSFAVITDLAGAATIVLTLRRFGEFTVVAQTQRIANQVINFIGQTDLNNQPGGQTSLTVMLDDVTETGNKAVVAVCHGVSGDVVSRRVVALIEITISGQPPGATMAAKLIAQDSDMEWYDPWFGKGLPFPPPATMKTAAWAFSNGSWHFLVWDGYHATGGLLSTIVLAVAGSSEYRREYLVGARYTTAAALEVVKGRVERYATTTADVSPGIPGAGGREGFLLTGSETITGFARLTANGIAINEIAWTYSASGTQYGGIPNAIINTATVGGVTTSGSNVMSPFTENIGGGLQYNGSVMPINVYDDIIFQRYSNSLYGIVLRAPYDMSLGGAAFLSPRGRWFGAVCGKLTTDPGVLKIPIGSANPIYATEHPVTGQIVRASTPCCWV